MDIFRALRLTRNSRVALVGAGGKTTALFTLARAFGTPVLVSASTHLGVWQCEQADHHFMVSRQTDFDTFTDRITGVTLFTGAQDDDRRLAGLDMETLGALNRLANRLDIPLLIEADGSRQRPLKAPAPHEPAIPEWVNHVIVAAGLSGLGKPLDESVVHRPEIYSQLSRVGEGQVINPEDAARVLTHPSGGLKNMPAGAKRTLLLNQADDRQLYISGMRVANTATKFYNQVIITSLKNKTTWATIEPTAGIILASGGAARFGQPKILMPWRGKPLIHHAVTAAIAGGLDPIIVVLGPVVEPVRAALAGLPVTITENALWQHGMSTSIRKGLESLPGDTGAALFLLADQPTVTPEVIKALIARHQETLAAIVAPRVGSRRTNPVLFDVDTFPELMQIEGDIGGRAIFHKHTIEYVDWEDARLLIDVDTLDDFQKLSELG